MRHLGQRSSEPPLTPDAGDLFGVSRFLLADVGQASYRKTVERRRHTWLRHRKASGEQNITQRPNDRNFRSDNDLYQWWMWGRVAVPITLLSLAALVNFGVPFAYTLLATVPAIIYYLFLRVMARRNRKAGKRFNQYDADDISW